MALAIAAIWVYGNLGLYCHFYPAIDTRFAPDFSEKAFDEIAVGMDYADVIGRLGEPLWKQNTLGGLTEFQYTSDGKCFWGDFAWLGRSVFFKEGKVLETKKYIYYD